MCDYDGFDMYDESVDGCPAKKKQCARSVIGANGKSRRCKRYAAAGSKYCTAHQFSCPSVRRTMKKKSKGCCIPVSSALASAKRREDVLNRQLVKTKAAIAKMEHCSRSNIVETISSLTESLQKLKQAASDVLASTPPPTYQEAAKIKPEVPQPTPAPYTTTTTTYPGQQYGSRKRRYGCGCGSSC